MSRILAGSIGVALVVIMLVSGSVSAITIDALSVAELGNYIPADMVGNGPAPDPPIIGDGPQGVDGISFFADADGVVSDDDDPIPVGDPFDIILGPATGNHPYENININALLITVTFDVSGGMALLPGVTLSGTFDGDTDSATLALANFGQLSTLGFAGNAGGDSFTAVDNDFVAAFLITGPDFDADWSDPTAADIGDYTLTVAGWTDDYWDPTSLYRIDLFGVDLDYNGGEIVSGASNSAGGYLVPEPGSLVIIGGLLLGIAGKRRTMSRK